MSSWYNPSRSAVIYDRRNDRHIQPGETTSVEPDRQLVITGKLIRLGTAEKPVPAEPQREPLRVVSSLELAETVAAAPSKPSKPLSLLLAEDVPDAPKANKKSKG